MEIGVREIDLEDTFDKCNEMSILQIKMEKNLGIMEANGLLKRWKEISF